MVNLIFLICAAMATLTVYLVIQTLSLWWILPVLIGAYLTAVILYWLFIIAVWFFLPSKKQVNKPIPICTAMIRLTAEWFCSITRLRLCLKKNVELPDEPCVMICNHLSFFDPMAMIALSKDRKLVCVSKKENEKIPLAGRYLKGACFLSVDRSNPRQAVQMLQHAGDEMKRLGVDVVIYPEGTRSKTGKLTRFKDGGFVLAKQADAPIAVYTVKGTEKIKKRFPFRSTRITLELVKVIDKETVRAMDAKELSQCAHDIVAEALGG